MNPPRAQVVALLLDEMHSSVVARTLRQHGFDVMAITDSPDLRAATDEEVFAYAAAHERRIATENTKDFRRILLRAEESGQPTAGVLFTSSRSFPRSRRNPGPLIRALTEWLLDPAAVERPLEDWLLPG